MLIKGWPECYFTVHSTELDKILSMSYEELKLRNITLSNKMELFVENELINLRFFSNVSEVRTIKDAFLTLGERINLVFDNISLLHVQYYSNPKEVDDRFLYVAKFVVQNIHILKGLLKSTYDKLPWEEIEFCLIYFISLHIKEQDLNLFMYVVLTKCRILDHLECFSKTLKDVFANMDDFKRTNLPRLKREDVMQKIVRHNPQFEELYKDYQKIRDIHSLESINNYINLASSINVQEREGQTIIARVLQVTGENLKSTLESPKLSNITSELLLLSLPRNTREIVIKLRDSLSHVESLTNRMMIEDSTDSKFFIGVQNDIKQIGTVINDALYRSKIKIIKKLLNIIISSESSEIINILKLFGKFGFYSKIPTNVNIMVDHEKLESLVRELSNNVTEENQGDHNLFDKIIDKIQFNKNKFKDKKINYFMGFKILQSSSAIYYNVKMDSLIVKVLKLRASQTLQNMTLEMEPSCLNDITFSLKEIFRTVTAKMKENFDKVFKLLLEIFILNEFNINNMKWIEELKEKLNDKGHIITSASAPKIIAQSEDMYYAQLKLKLSQLENILKHVSGNIVIENILYLKSNKKLLAVIEMLVLDIMSILDSTKKRSLENNSFYLDDTIPLLIGKCLRNHLAHDNAVVGMLLYDPSVALLLNARKLIIEDIIRSKKKIGRVVKDDPSHLKVSHNQKLSFVANQEKMFAALERGDLTGLKSSLNKGADLKGRDLNLWTALHLAAKSNCLSITKFILEQNFDSNAKNSMGQNPLHVAAEYGREKSIEFFLNKTHLSVDDVDNNGQTPLHYAAQNGHKDSVETLLKYKANTFTQNISGFSPLHQAIRNYHVDVVKILLGKDKNIDVNVVRGGFTPLHLAAEGNCLELVNFLIKNGANVTSKNDMNWMPLHAASLNGCLETMNALIVKGAIINAQTKDGCTPLHYATESGNQKAVEALLNHGAIANVVDKLFSCTPLHYAAKVGYGRIVDVLLKNNANVRVTTVERMTPLHFAAQGGHVDIVISLLKFNIDIDARNEDFSTALHYASNGGHTAVVKLLIKNKSHINAKNRNGSTPLHLAASNNFKDVVQLLMENNAEVNVKSRNGHTPLHDAAANCGINAIELLVKNNANVNIIDNLGYTPLHTAVSCGHKEAVHILIKHNAVTNSGDKINKTSLHIAAHKGNTEIMSILIENEVDINAKDNSDSTPLHIAAKAGYKAAVENLIENGANVDALNKDKMTPLLYAVKQNYKDIVQYLILKKADVNIEGSMALSIAVCAGYIDIVNILLKSNGDINTKYAENFTLLHMASKRGHTEILKALIIKGCTVDPKTVNGATPLYLAAKEGYKEIVETLLTKGADINVKYCKGYTPLHVAATEGHVHVVKVLLNNVANFEIDDPKHRSSIELAVAYGHFEVVKVLIEYTINMTVNDNNNWTLLHTAAYNNNLEIIKYLINKGFDINTKNTSGLKPIQIAAKEGFVNIVEVFLSKGSNINDLGVDRQTLLHYAAMSGQLNIVKYLLKHGADINYKDDNDVTPIYIAASLGYKSILEVLLANGAIYNALNKFNQKPSDVAKKDALKILSATQKLFEGVKHNSPLEVENCIKAGASINASDAGGNTPLHFAAWKGCTEIVNMLLKYRANVNANGYQRGTPLHYAAKYSHLQVVKALLSHGAVYNLLSHGGRTPLDFATDRQTADLLKLVSESFKSIENNNCKIINDLKNVNDVHTIKAIMNACNTDYKTLIVVALHNGFPKVEQLKEIFQEGVSIKIHKALELYKTANYDEALIIFKNVFETRKEILGSDNPGTLDIKKSIAEIMYKKGVYQESLNIYEEIYQKQKELLGLYYKDTLKTRSSIALVLHGLGRNDEALDIYQNVYEKQKVLLGANHRMTLETETRMALVLNGLGKYEDALCINQKIYQKLLDANDQSAVNVQNNIAMTLGNQCKLEEALKMFTEVLDKKKSLLGVKHPDTLRTLQHISRILFKQNKYSEALKTYEENLNMLQKVLGVDHPDTLSCQYGIADVLLYQGNLISALKIFKELSLRRKAIWGQNDPIAIGISVKIEFIITKFKWDGLKESHILQLLQTDVYTAAHNGDAQTVEYMIKNGFDVNDKNADGRTLLHFAISNGHINIVNILLRNGADATQTTRKGKTSLHTAVSKGYKDIVNKLLEHVIRSKLNFINAQTSGGNTALHVAAKIGSLDIVLALLKHGAAYNIHNKKSKIPLDCSNHKDVIKLLKLTAELFSAAKNGHEMLIIKLKAVARDSFLAITNARSYQGSTLLQVAINSKHKSIADELLKVMKGT